MWLVLVFITLIAGALAGVYAYSVYRELNARKVGNARVAELSGIIHGGAMAFLKREYTWLAPFVVVVALLLCVLLGVGSMFAFILGALCSASAGYIGMHIATRTNGLTAAAASGEDAEGVITEENKGEAPSAALRIAFSGGSIVGMVVIALGLIGLAISYLFLNDVNVLTAFGMGASSIALFARVGGGIYTKAADVGADLVGKVEAGIPEDDPRNPAVIADNVGDNVGDIAGMGADLFESYVNAIIAAMAIGLTYQFTNGSALGLWGVGFPLILSACGVVASIIGCMIINHKDLRGGTEIEWILSLIHI